MRTIHNPSQLKRLGMPRKTDQQPNSRKTVAKPSGAGTGAGAGAGAGARVGAAVVFAAGAPSGGGGGVASASPASAGLAGRKRKADVAAE